jgi:hypothetical protein
MSDRSIIQSQGPDHEVLTGTVAPVYALDVYAVTGYLAIGIGSEVHIAREISGSERINKSFGASTERLMVPLP